MHLPGLDLDICDGVFIPCQVLVLGETLLQDGDQPLALIQVSVDCVLAVNSRQHSPNNEDYEVLGLHLFRRVIEEMGCLTKHWSYPSML